MNDLRFSQLDACLVPQALRKRDILQGIECTLHVERSAATNWRWLAAASANGKAKAHRLHESEREPEEAMKWAYVIARSLTYGEGPEYPIDYCSGWADVAPALAIPMIQ